MSLRRRFFWDGVPSREMGLWLARGSGLVALEELNVFGVRTSQLTVQFPAD